MRQLMRNIQTHQHGMGHAPPAVFQLPAKTVLPFIQGPLGRTLVKPIAAIKRTAALIVLPIVFLWLRAAFVNQPVPDTGHFWLVCFALASVAMTLFIFARRETGWRKGQQIHTEEQGWSWLAWRTDLPLALTEAAIIPGSFAVAGWVIAHTFSLELGWWFILCAASLLLNAVWNYARYRDAVLVTSDGMIQAQTSSWRVEQAEAKARASGGGAGGDTPEFAEMGAGPIETPDAMGWRQGSDSAAPDFMAWFRKAARKGVAPDAKAPPMRGAGVPRGKDERTDYADIG